MTSPLETIATRVLAEHRQSKRQLPGSTLYVCACGASVSGVRHEAHVAAEIARAVAEDEGLESLLWDAIATVRDADPRLPNDADTGDVTAAVIDALTREENQ